MQQGDLLAAELEAAAQRFTLQQGLQAGGGEPLPGQLQQQQQAAAQPRLALLAAVGEPPVQLHASGVAIAEHRGHQGREGVHLGGHHQHVAGLQAGVVGQQLQDAVAHDLHLPQPARTGVKFQRVVPGGALQGLVGFGPATLQLPLHQLPLQLMQQRGVAAPAGGIGEQVPLLLHAQLHLAAALQQLLKVPAQAAEAGLQARGLQQPVPLQGLLQGDRIAEGCAPAAAALPQVWPRREQVEIHLAVAAEGLQQLHLQRRHAAQAKQAQHRRQAAGRGWALA